MRRLAVLLMASLFLVACATSSPSAVPSSDPPGSAAGAGIVGPVILDADHLSTSVSVGRTVVFDVAEPESWKISADPDGIVRVQAGSNDGSATFAPGAEALKPGAAAVTLTNPAGDTLVFTITVE